MKLFLSPHNDDEVLFGTFTILRENPEIVIVFDSHVQGQRTGQENWRRRREESMRGLQELSVPRVWPTFLGLSDALPIETATLCDALRQYGEPEMVYAPAVEVDGHVQHNIVGFAANQVFPRVTHYLTYTRIGKSRSENEVQPRNGDDIARKLRALACYSSQMEMEPKLGCWPHFMRDLTEYYL
jgi:LmbE family N-acetylglucosaminyl deacetylase